MDIQCKMSVYGHQILFIYTSKSAGPAVYSCGWNMGEVKLVRIIFQRAVSRQNYIAWLQLGHLSYTIYSNERRYIHKIYTNKYNVESIRDPAKRTFLEFEY